MKNLRGPGPVPNKMRYLGVDYGRARIGLAISDPSGTLAQPLGVLKNRPGAIEEIRRIIASHGVERIVVGLPLNMNGEEGEMAVEARNFAHRLREATGLPVDTVDERLTSWEAHSIMKEAGLRRKRRSQMVDKVAATLILERYLARQKKDASGC